LYFSLFFAGNFKVAEKLCNYYDLCKKGQHLKVAEEINSISLPKMNVKYEDKDADMEVQENGVSPTLYVGCNEVKHCTKLTIFCALQLRRLLNNLMSSA
jgi:hypothetical protein